MTKWAKFGLFGAALVLTVVVGAEVLRIKPSPSGSVNAMAGTDLHGKPWSLAEHLGKRPVVVNFFATWCGPCQMEVPELVRLRDRYKDRGVQLVLFSEEGAAVLKSAGMDKAPIPVLAEMSPAFKQHKVEGIPRTLFFDRSGSLAADLEGYDPAGIGRIGEALEAMPVVASRR